MAEKGWPTIYEGLGTTVEAAVQDARKQIPLRQGFDFVACRVVEWGYQRGGFADTELFFVRAVEELGSFKSK